MTEVAMAEVAVGRGPREVSGPRETMLVPDAAPVATREVLPEGTTTAPEASRPIPYGIATTPLAPG